MHRSPKKTKYLILYVGGLVALLILSCFLGLTVEQDRMITNSVRLSAERLFECIVLTRRWNAGYSGVYVHKGDGVLSNPYLKHPDITTASGLTYTLKNPALMTREISELAKKSGDYTFHITSLNLLNPGNMADPWEEESLKAFERSEGRRTQVTEIDGRKIFRLMRPLMVEEGCLKCHAGQGYKIGEVRGGISVSLPFDDAAGALTMNRIKMGVLAGAIVLIFSCLFYFVVWRLISRLFRVSRELEQQKRSLEELNG